MAATIAIPSNLLGRTIHWLEWIRFEGQQNFPNDPRLKELDSLIHNLHNHKNS